MKSELTVPVGFKYTQHVAIFFTLLFSLFLTGCSSTQLAGFDVGQPGESQLDACPQISGYFSQTGQTIWSKRNERYPLSEKSHPQALIDIFSMMQGIPTSVIKQVDPLAPVHIQTDQDKVNLVFTLLDKQTYTLSVPAPHRDPSGMESSTSYCHDGRLLLLYQHRYSMAGEVLVSLNHALVLRIEDGALLVDARYHYKSYGSFIVLPIFPVWVVHMAKGQFRFDPH